MSSTPHAAPSFSRPQSISASWNGSPGAVHTPVTDDHNPMSPHPDPAASSATGKDAIREGKQKAKEVMANAGITPQAQSSGTPNGTPQANGGLPLSRKRSRDGTRLPQSQANDMLHARDEVLLDRYLQRDMLHAAAMNDQAERSRDLVKSKETEKEFYLHQVKQRRQTNPGSVFGYGFMGYGNRTTDGKTQIVYNSMRGPPKGRRSRELYVPRKDAAQQAEQHEELVPVRLDIELDKLRLRDTFTWNLHEKLISQDLFTDHLLEDLRIPPEAILEVSRQVKAEIQDQIHNFYPHIIVEDGPLEPGRSYNDHKDDEMRIQIKLNVTIGKITLIDQFEWDINNPLNSPEEFARQMAWENALSGEFTTAIAHSIREQSQLYTKSLYLTNHCFDGRPVDDADLRDGFLPGPIHSAFRSQHAQKDWTPYMYEMSEAELERTETSMMREHRAQKRQLNRRGGPALPDLKDRQRTVRSLLVHSVIPGAVETFETTGIPKTRRSSRPSRRGGVRVEGDADSDEMDSEESGVESPAPSAQNAGTARTRNMRGAASAAQAAMRQNLTRSQTPDSQLLALPEPTRASARRSLLREESVPDDSDTLVVKLKIGKAKFRAWLDEVRAKKRASEYPLSGYASQPPPPSNAQATTPSRPAAAAAAATATAATATPTATPRSATQSRSTPQPNGQPRAPSASRQTQHDHLGRAETDHWPHPDDTPPPPPPWLNEAIQTLRNRHPESDFEPVMRPYALDAASEQTIRTNLEPGAPAPAGVKLQFMPRIRCNDCPGKLYTAQPGRVVDDFQVHLRNRAHRERVTARQS